MDEFKLIIRKVFFLNLRITYCRKKYVYEGGINERIISNVNIITEIF